MSGIMEESNPTYTVSVFEWVDCSHCHGTGGLPDIYDDELATHVQRYCSSCGGKGEHRIYVGSEVRYR